MYNSKNFSVMAYANGFTLWNYSTADTLVQVKAANYFNETAPFARVGDMIMVAANNETSVESSILSVKTIGDKTVSVAGLTA